MHRSSKQIGFTLTELMIVIAILGLLSAVLSPKFGTMMRKSKEADVKTNLGILRSALNIYFADNKARFPTGPVGSNKSTLSDTLSPKYLPSIPTAYVHPYHSKATTVDNVANDDFQGADPSDDGEWVYISNEGNTKWGLVAIECYHSDSRGFTWSEY